MAIVTDLIISNETPAGDIDGVNKVFTLDKAPNPEKSLELFLNGKLQVIDVDYTLYNLTITFETAPWSGSNLKIHYRYVEIAELYTELARITDAGNLAGKDKADFNDDVDGVEKPANNATKNDGALADKDKADFATDVDGAEKPANNADVTGDNVAASISGQGNLATENAADFATQVDGVAKPANNATKNDGALADKDTVAASDIDTDAVEESKIKDSNVNVDSLKMDKFILDFPFTTLDGWTQSHTGTGAVSLCIGSTELRTGATNGSKGKIIANARSESWAVRYDKNPRFIVSVSLGTITDTIAYILAGGDDQASFGFKQVNNELFAYHRKDAVITTTKVADISAVWTRYRLKAIYTSGSKIEFYVNNVLLATHTTNLPEDSEMGIDEIVWAFFEITNQAAANKEMFLQHMALTQDI